MGTMKCKLLQFSHVEIQLNFWEVFGTRIITSMDLCGKEGFIVGKNNLQIKTVPRFGGNFLYRFSINFTKWFAG